MGERGGCFFAREKTAHGQIAHAAARKMWSSGLFVRNDKYLPKRLLTKAIEKPIGGGGENKRRKNHETGGKNYAVTEKYEADGSGRPGPEHGSVGSCCPGLGCLHL